MLKYALTIVNKAFRRKKLADAQSMETPLRRCLSVWHLVFYGVANMAGAGIYVLSGTIIRNYAGPAASVSFLICSVASLFTGMCYVEFASLVPRAGSSYTYTYCVLGELPAFVVGWTMLFDYLLSMASVAKAFSGTVDSMTRRKVSAFLTAKLGTLPTWWGFDETWDLMAVGLILFLSLLVLGGAKFSMSVNAGLSSLQLICLITITCAAFVYGNLDNWRTGNGFFAYGASGVLEGASIAMFAYSGFESIGTAAEECRNPRRDLPRALFLSLLAVSILYVTATLGLSYLQPYTQLDISAPFTSAFASKSGAKWAEITAAVGTLLATGATKVSGLFVIPRLLYALATDGVIFSTFGSVNEVVQVPLTGLAFGALVSSALALFFNIKFLAEMVSMGTLVSYCFVGIDLFVLRYLHFAGPPDNDVPLRPWASGLARCLPGLSRVRFLRATFVSYVVACFMLAGSFQVASITKITWTWILVAPCSLLVVFLFLALTVYSPRDIPGMYTSPGLPLAPLITILVNAIMLVRLSPYAWVRFFSWLKFGSSIYTFYGMWHSKVSDADTPDDDYPDAADEPSDSRKGADAAKLPKASASNADNKPP